MRALLKFLLIAVATPAFAGMPVFNLRPARCDQKPSKIGDSHSLVQKVNIIGESDDREPLSDSSDISESEKAMINKMVGPIECKTSFGIVRATGVLVEDGGQILTSAHTYADENLKITEPFPSCQFHTKDNPKNKLGVVLNEGFYKLATHDPDKDRGNDYGLARLSQIVSGVETAKFGPPPVVGETLYLVTAFARGSKNKINPSQLVVRKCVTQESYRAEGDGQRTFLNTCDSAASDSGGVYFARREGKLESVGIHQSGGFESANGLSFDISNSDRKKLSYGMGIGINEKARKESADLARKANACDRRQVNSATGCR